MYPIVSNYLINALDGSKLASNLTRALVGLSFTGMGVTRRIFHQLDPFLWSFFNVELKFSWGEMDTHV